MREIFTNQKNYWEITPQSNNIKDDIVIEKTIGDINSDELPEAGAKFILYNQKLKDYAAKLNDKTYEDDFDVKYINTEETMENIEYAGNLLDYGISISFDTPILEMEFIDRYEIKKDIILNNLSHQKQTAEGIHVKNLSTIDDSICEEKILIANINENFSLKAA